MFDSLNSIGERISALEEVVARLKEMDSVLGDLRAIMATFADTIQGGLGIVQDGRIIYLNEFGARVLGYEPRELINKDAIALAHPDYRKRFEARVKLIQAGDSWPVTDSWPMLKKDHTLRHLRFFAGRTSYRAKPAVVFFYHDVTEEKKTKDELAMRAELLELVADFIFVLDASGKIRYVNKAMYEVLGYSSAEMLGRNILDFHTSEHREKVSIRLKLATPASTGIYRTEYVCSDGTLIPVSARGKMIELGGAQHVLGLARPIELRDGQI